MFQKKKLSKIWLLSALLFFCSCFSVPEIHYTEAVDGEKANGKNRLIIQLYDNDINNEKISIKTNDNMIIFQGSKINESINTKISGNSKVLEFALNENVKFIYVKYERERYKLSMNKKYSILFIGMRNTLDVLYTNREPIYTD